MRVPWAGIGRRSLEAPLTVLVLFAAVSLRVLPSSTQDEISAGLRSTVLQPFLGLRATVTTSSASREELSLLRRSVDSLTAVAVAAGAMEEEVRSLRELLEFQETTPLRLLGVRVVRAGPESEGMFFLDRGSSSGVLPGAPVVSHRGLFGRIIRSNRETATGIDWTHSDFRASAMLEDGSDYGVVHVVRGRYREEDRLVMDGLPYHRDPVEGRRIVTSGLGSVFPRGIPIGTISSLRESREPWSKTYWLEPAVHPASVLHAVVGVGRPGDDVRRLWMPEADASGAAEESAADTGEARAGTGTSGAPSG